ncbi:uncharacterized protein EAF02_009394 [Botrytis sinoallii]|uniref:uncharacterized protein n=1 Tax=Botrytis sinoallii TaxID=1463999 RepID=UPI0019020311|nr:uncharacterized protein EAF02_009394 [Botrytis sinoallii]KAF7870204.1 hypothetical protein EAF02_009394 [Botrytis sinoallii]
MEDLPKTFEDAIEVCMQLKIRYIWIDSLCIIQDDKEDWARESVTMIDVYGSGVLNIAASSSIDGSQGCFFDRQDLLKCRISLKINRNNDAMYDCIPNTKHPLDDPIVCPLESRGWTLQERLLSPRTVHFTWKEVFWECHTNFVSESSAFYSDRTERQKKEQLSIDIWDKIVTNYSGRHLTYEEDRLIRLAGIAAKMQQQKKDEYFAGMWSNDLIRRLCWNVTDQHVRQRISPRRAPTWSWASVASQVQSLDSDSVCDTPLSRILKVEKPATENQFGDMPNLKLWLSCPPLLIAEFIPPNTLFLGGSFMIYYWYKIDCVEGTGRVKVNSKTYNVYILLPLSVHQGIILKRIEGDQGVYKRIGMALTLPVSAMDEKNNADETAYVPREKHNFDTDEHVICLV